MSRQGSHVSISYTRDCIPAALMNLVCRWTRLTFRISQLTQSQTYKHHRSIGLPSKQRLVFSVHAYLSFDPWRISSFRKAIYSATYAADSQSPQPERLSIRILTIPQSRNLTIMTGKTPRLLWFTATQSQRYAMRKPMMPVSTRCMRATFHILGMPSWCSAARPTSSVWRKECMTSRLHRRSMYLSQKPFT